MLPYLTALQLLLSSALNHPDIYLTRSPKNCFKIDGCLQANYRTLMKSQKCLNELITTPQSRKKIDRNCTVLICSTLIVQATTGLNSEIFTLL